MIYSLSGTLTVKTKLFIIIETSGIGFKVFVSKRTINKLPKINSKAKIFCHTHVNQNGIELYGFYDKTEMDVFEMLTSISGVGPKMALKILSVIKPEELMSAVNKKRSDLLTKISGVGKKTAERIILELKDKIAVKESEEIISMLEIDVDISEALKRMGYRQNEVKEAVKSISSKIEKPEERIRTALKFLSKR